MFSYCAFLLWETPSLSLSLKPLKWVFVLVSVNDFNSDNTDLKVYTSNPVNTDTEGTIERVRINGVSLLSVLNLEKMKRLSFPWDKSNCPL